MSRIDGLVAQHCPNGVRFESIDALVDPDAGIK